jgi:hypothetical protein
MRLGAGRPQGTPQILAVRELTVDEVATMRPAKSAAVAKLRDSHHRIARLLAAGLRYAQVAERTGYSYQRIATLATDPAMAELVSLYRSEENAAFYASRDDYYELILSNGLKAERMIADQLDAADEAGEAIPLSRLLPIARDAADRTGYGKRATQVNVNIDFAAQLDRAIKRSSIALDSPSGTVSSQSAVLEHGGATAISPLSHSGPTIDLVPAALADPADRRVQGRASLPSHSPERGQIPRRRLVAA